MKPDHPASLTQESSELIGLLATRIATARSNNRPVIAAFGAHTIRNGLSPIISHLLEHDWITHLATNGAGFIHDWEFSFLGKTCEDVAAGVADGTFGNWEETGRNINLAVNIGAFNNTGYGQAIGALIHNQKIHIPDRERLMHAAQTQISAEPMKQAAAAALAAKLDQFKLPSGTVQIPHPWKIHSLSAAAFRMKIPFTCHPMFGHDIIYNHPMNCGALLGIAAEIDFEEFAAAVAKLSGGVYLSVGSAVMSPMIFEKSLSIARNIARQHQKRIENFTIANVDLDTPDWDWNKSEPPKASPSYFRRNNKTFSRMGGEFLTLGLDNRDFFLGLSQALSNFS